MSCRESFWQLIGVSKAVIEVFLRLWVQLSLSLSFAVYDESVVIRFSRQTQASSMSLSPARCFVSLELAAAFKGSHFSPQPAWLLCTWFPVAVPRASVEVPTFVWAAKMRVTKWGCWVQHLTLLSPLLSFRELPLWRWSCKLSFRALFWHTSHKYPVSSLIVWHFVYVSLLQK